MEAQLELSAVAAAMERIEALATGVGEGACAIASALESDGGVIDASAALQLEWLRSNVRALEMRHQQREHEARMVSAQAQRLSGMEAERVRHELEAVIQEKNGEIERFRFVLFAGCRGWCMGIRVCARVYVRVRKSQRRTPHTSYAVFSE